MKQSYKHLLLAKREKISIWKAKGLSLRKIAKRLGRNVSSISRELKRNAPPRRPGRYLPARAHARATLRNQISRNHLRLKKPELRRYVLRKLRQGLSPEQIAGEVDQEKSKISISHEAVYQFIYRVKLGISFPSSFHRKRLRRWHSHNHRKSHILPQRVSITLRPAIVKTPDEYGHWEMDTMISRQSKASILVMVERKSRLVKLAWLPQKSAPNTRMAINRRLGQFSKGLRRTITYDNGSETVEHLQVNAVLGARFLLCMPFHSWEKGTVENTNGLIRRFYPKKTDFANITPAQSGAWNGFSMVVLASVLASKRRSRSFA